MEWALLLLPQSPYEAELYTKLKTSCVLSCWQIIPVWEHLWCQPAPSFSSHILPLCTITLTSVSTVGQSMYIITTDDIVVWIGSWKANFSTDPFVSAGWLADARLAGTDGKSSAMLLSLRCTPTAFLVFFGGTDTGFVDEPPAGDDWPHINQSINWSINRSINQSINHLINRSIYLSFSASTGSSFKFWNIRAGVQPHFKNWSVHLPSLSTRSSPPST